MKNSTSEICVDLIQIWLFPFAIQWLWKLVVVPVTGFLPLSYWQAFGLRFLVAFLKASSSAWRVRNYVGEQERREEE